MTMQLEEQVRSRAYALWEARGRPEGSPEEDWLMAEREIKTELEVTGSSLSPVAAKAADALEPNVLAAETPQTPQPRPRSRRRPGGDSRSAPAD